MSTRRHALIGVAAITLAATSSLSSQSPAPQAWVSQSNQHAKLLLDVVARLSPEGAGQVGVDGYDEAITDISPGFEGRAVAAYRTVAGELAKSLTRETDQRVKQDLQILIESANDSVTGVELRQKHTIPYFNVAQAVFGGLRPVLDDQVAPERRKAALVRLRKYAGSEPGSTPFAVLAEQAIRARMSNSALVWPAKLAVERGLADTASFIDGIPKLFDKFQITGYEDPCARLTSTRRSSTTSSCRRDCCRRR